MLYEAYIPKNLATLFRHKTVLVRETKLSVQLGNT